VRNFYASNGPTTLNPEFETLTPKAYNLSWSKDEDAMLHRRLEQLAEQSKGGDTIAVPSMSPTVQEAIELCMETGQKVAVGGGVISDWEPESLAILPNSTVNPCTMHTNGTLNHKPKP
jgi:hypothetical protein